MSTLLNINFEEEADEDTSQLKRINRIRGKKSLINSIFEFYRASYYKKNPKERALFNQKVQVIFTNLIWCIQISSLLWIPDLQITGWKDIMTVWEYLGYLRLDTICAASNVVNFCIYASLGIILFNFTGILFLASLIYHSVRIPRIFYRTFRRTLYIGSHFSLIPNVALLTLCLKYSFFPKDYALEYPEGNNGSDFKVNVGLLVAIIILLIIYFFILLLNAVFSGDIRHSMAKQILEARAHSRVEFHLAFFTYLSPILHAFLAVYNIVYFQILIMIFSGILMAEVMIYLPYFSTFVNCIMALRFFIVMMMAFIFVFARIIDKAFVITLFAAIILPILCLILIQIIIILQRKIKNEIPASIKLGTDIYGFEHLLRYALCLNNSIHSDQILQIFADCFLNSKLYSYKLTTIWETNYCIFTLNNDVLAKIKLSKGRESDITLEGIYQEYSCKKILSDYDSNESTEFLKYFNKIQDIRIEDEIVCNDLLDFWKELVSFKPELQKLNKMLISISDSIFYLNKEYTNLVVKFPKSKEAYLMYSSYVRNILSDVEKANYLESRMRSIGKIATNSFRDNKNISYFDESNGLIIISGENKDFGKITYANSKAAEILKYPLQGIIENSIDFFMPKPYSIYFKDIYTNIQPISDTELDLPPTIFLKLPNHSIIQCSGRISVTSIQNSIILVFAFKEKESKHQIALVSEEGEIYDYTEKFVENSGKTAKNLRGHSLKKLFPSLTSKNLVPFEPYKLYSTKETYLILCNSTFLGLSINYIVLLNDYLEIESWKHGDAEEAKFGKNIRFSSASNISLKYASSILPGDEAEKSTRTAREMKTVGFDSKPDVSQASIEDTIALTEICEKLENLEKNEKIVESEKMSQKSDNLSQSHVLENIVISTSKSINIFHCVFIISIIVVLATNSAVLFYTSSKVESASNIDIPITVGNIEKAINSIAHFARGILVIKDSQGPQEIIDYCFDHFLSTLAALDDLHLIVLTNVTGSSSCSSRNIFSDENIDYWKVDDGFYLEKTNLIDLLADFIRKGNSFAGKLDNWENVTEELIFFVVNGWGETLKRCNSSFYDSVDCELNGINDLKVKMDALLSVGFGVLVLCNLIMIPFGISVVNMKNKFWNLIKEFALISYIELKQACIDRLSSIHGECDIMFTDGNRMSKKANFKNYWKYTWRIGAYLLITFVFYLINISYLYLNCADFLYLRPTLLRNIINSQVLYIELSVWSSEILAEDSLFDLRDIIPEAYPFKEPEIKANEVYSALEYSISQLKNKKYNPLLSDAYMAKFYEHFSNSTNYMEHGALAGGNIITVDSSYMDNAHEKDWIGTWYNLMVELDELDLKYDILISSADSDSLSVIKSQLNWIIISLVIYIFFSLLLYLIFYLPFFRKEINNLKRMKVMSSIIPVKYSRK
ncbi:unnamed protein product [Blepharisma stoltei]|uniref:TmcB/TmcC TPR repeats domain-containing protein n=1 Tax=Blepharisma stoltei TaxID=1481888 RepID=A0AAU9INT5_9CILI|nr:unnamed protein product [Blepharisma stoltei]